MLPEVTIAGMADFVPDELREDPSAGTVLAQAELLVQAQVGIDDLPDSDTRGRLLYTSAVYEMAGLLLIDKRHAADRRRPVKSETIGQYTYTTGTVAGLVESSMWMPRLRAHRGIGTVR
jgi:hypothetical protein